MIGQGWRIKLKIGIIASIFLSLMMMPPGPLSADTGDKHTADIIFQSMCSGGGTNGILDADFPVKISWRCSKCGAKQEVTVDLKKNDNTDSIAKKIADAINGAVAGSDNVRVTYYQSQSTNKQNQNWYRIHFEGVDQVDAGAWHSKLKLIVVAWEGVRVIAPSGRLPPNVTPGKPGRTLKPGKVIEKDKKKRDWTGDEPYGWKEVSFSVGLHPWPGPGQIEGFQPWFAYRIPSYESDPDRKVFDDLQNLMMADGFEILRLGETSLAILAGPNHTIVSTVLLNTISREDIKQEEHWTVGDVISNTDEDKPAELPRRMAQWLQSTIQTRVVAELSRIATDVALRAGLTPWNQYPLILAEDPWLYKILSDPVGDLYGVSGASVMGEDCQDITRATVFRSGQTITFTLTVNDELPAMNDFRDGAMMILIDCDGDGDVIPARGIIDFYQGGLDVGIFIPSPEFGEPPIFIEDLRQQGHGTYDTTGATFSIRGDTIEIQAQLDHIESPNVMKWIGAIRKGIMGSPIEDRIPNTGLGDP